jgi:hypothetical protein
MPDTTTYKAISLHEPWASLIGEKIKNYETRSWATNFRGDLIICAAKRKDSSQRSTYLYLRDKHNLNVGDFDSLRFGCAIALVTLSDCIKMDQHFIDAQTELEIDCGGWSVGRYAWKLENIRKIVPEIQIKGKQGFFKVDIAHD